MSCKLKPIYCLYDNSFIDFLSCYISRIRIFFHTNSFRYSFCCLFYLDFINKLLIFSILNKEIAGFAQMYIYIYIAHIYFLKYIVKNLNVRHDLSQWHRTGARLPVRVWRNNRRQLGNFASTQPCTSSLSLLWPTGPTPYTTHPVPSGKVHFEKWTSDIVLAAMNII